MIKNFQIRDLKCVGAHNDATSRIIYMIYPLANGFDNKWLEEQANRFECSIVVIYVPLNKWNDYLTPWPEPGETPGAEPFGGKGDEFLNTLQRVVIPEIETAMGISEETERNLIGVSLAGLFTLWAWLQCSTFHSIGCLSGSFWYEGFINWFNDRTIPQKDGKAYFLLGTAEPNANVKAFRTVGINTEAIVSALEKSGVNTAFDWVPGNHFANPLQRATKALAALA